MLEMAPYAIADFFLSTTFMRRSYSRGVFGEGAENGHARARALPR